MTIMTPLLASQIRSPSPPTSFWRWGAAPETPETPARSCSNLTALGKIRAQLSRTDSSPQSKPLDAGASARKRDHPALTAAFKSP
jgi:hypothetical protein